MSRQVQGLYLDEWCQRPRRSVLVLIGNNLDRKFLERDFLRLHDAGPAVEPRAAEPFSTGGEATAQFECEEAGSSDQSLPQSDSNPSLWQQPFPPEAASEAEQTLRRRPRIQQSLLVANPGVL